MPRHPTLSSSHLAFFFLLLLLFASLILGQSSSEVSEMRTRSDVMGMYKFENEEQCRRLCWYRNLCKKYSYYQDSASMLSNCVLHASPLDGTPFPSGWVETLPASRQSSARGCRDRVCSDTEVCVDAPSAPAPSNYRCLPLPANCGIPSVNNGTLTWTGLSQGHTATLTCDPLFTLTPTGMTSVLTCGVTGVWNPADIGCQIECQNGGSRRGNTCQCPKQYGGHHCERFIRDCTEMYDNGFKKNGVFRIQPVTSAEAFWVQCTFTYSIATIVLRHHKQAFKDMTWATCKSGLEGDLRTSSDPRDFFVGLDRLHQVTSQANYTAKVSLWVGSRGADAFYTDFTVGPENTSYTLTYTKHYPRIDDGLGDNGLLGKAPITFSSKDRDSNPCATNRGAPGWYGTDCVGKSFFADPVIWPVGGTDQQCVGVDLKVIRNGDFYAN